MNFKKLLMISCLLIALTLSVVSATEDNATSTIDDTEASFSDLIHEIELTNENETLILEKNYKQTDNNVTIIINKSLTIDGKGHTLDGNNKDRILKIRADNVTLKNINFINARAYRHAGGAVDWTGNNASLINCTFSNCRAPYAGGAVAFNGNNLTVINSVFSNNRALTSFLPDETIIYIIPWAESYNSKGGALYTKGNNVTVINSKFISNLAQNNNDFDGSMTLINTTGNFNPITGIVGDINNPFDELQDKIKETNDILILDKDYLFSGNNTEGILINKSITIDGNGHILDGNHLSGIFNITADNVILKNIVFLNAIGLEGCAVYGDSLVINCTFKYCISFPNPSLIINYKEPDSYGAAMYGGKAVNSTFISNHVKYGGAIYNGTAVNCLFVDNTADYQGGAIYDGIAINSTFINNTAYDDGGAVYGTYCINSTFINNNAKYGGAACNSDTFNCMFYMNKADFGGAVSGGSTTNCTFDKNQAGYYDFYDNKRFYEENGFLFPVNSIGGAVYCGNVNNCTFKNNIAFIGGGAVYNSNVKNSIFLNNTGIYYGGAVFLNEEYGLKRYEFINSTFINNSAMNGGAIFTITTESKLSLLKKCILVNNCSFINNNATRYGGAMNSGTVVNSTFIKNHAGKDGGSVCDSTIVNSIFNENSAENGGAVSNCEVVNCIFNNNSATTYGGAVYQSDITPDTLFSNNTAKAGNDTYDVKIIGNTKSKTFTDLNYLINSNEKEIFLRDNYTFNFIYDFDFIDGIIINHNITIHGNNVIIDGHQDARIFKIENASVVIENVRFLNGCTIDNGGGAVNGFCTIINSTFINNSAQGCGGAVYKTKCIDSTFINNYATSGGAVFNSTIISSIFINNTGHNGGAVMLGTVYNSLFINNGNGDGGAMSDGTVINCTFKNNHGRYGGAVNSVKAINSTFINNTGQYGGAMMGGEAINSIFINNTAKYYIGYPHFIGGNGGAILYGSAFNSIFINNTAAANGGAIYSRYSDNQMVIDKCIFINNSAEKDGGAVYLIQINTQDNIKSAITSSNFTDNLASRYGGAIYVTGENIWINNVIVTDNIAEKGNDIYTNSSSVHIINSKVKNLFNEQIIRKITIPNPKIISKDLKIYYKNNDKFSVTVYGEDGKLVANTYIKLTVGKNKYKVKTDEKGIARFSVASLTPGRHTLTVQYKSVKVKNTIIVKSRLITKDLTKKVKRTASFKVKVLNTNGKAFAKQKVKVKFNGKIYNIKTNSKGIASLKLGKNFKAGKYTIKTSYLGLKNTNKVLVKK